MADRNRETAALVTILSNTLMGEVASGSVPDELRHLDAMQAVRIARVLTPKVLEMLSEVALAAAVDTARAMVVGEV